MVHFLNPVLLAPYNSRVTHVTKLGKYLHRYKIVI
jgi:hypothetical protein